MIIVFFHVLYLFGKYVYEKFNVNITKSSELCVEPAHHEKSGCCINNINISLSNCELDRFYNENNTNASKINMKFSPPAYIQRYNAVINILHSLKYRGKIRKVVDFGCSELGFFKHLKFVSGLDEILCVDIDRDTLEKNKCKISPLSADYLHMKSHPFNVYIYEGSVTDADKRLQNTDAVICIELIEHLYPETLKNVPKNIFEFIKPQLAIITTPNAEFNVLFPNMNGFRHDDHKFEWTRKEFENWANDIITKYPNYEVTFEGICPGPEGTEKYGCCSQMAIFHRNDILHSNNALIGNDLFKLILHEEYPYRIDNRPDEVKILDEASYFIRKYQLNNDPDDGIMPLEYLTQVMDQLNVTIESFCDILSNGGYEIINNENNKPSLVLRPLSNYSSTTNLSSEQYDDWNFESQQQINDIDIEDGLDETIPNNELSDSESLNIIDDDTIRINTGNIEFENSSLLSTLNRDNALIEMPSFNDDTVMNRVEYNTSSEYNSMCSIFMEPSQNENSLECPENITDPNFQCSIVNNEDLSVSIINNDDISNDSFISIDSIPRLSSTPNKKKIVREKYLENCRDEQLNGENDLNFKIDHLINRNSIKKSLSCDNQGSVIYNQKTPSTSWSPEIISDSGYPNTYSVPDLTPEYDLPSIAQDSETESEPESINVQLPLNNFQDGEVVNGDLVNNNRDNEGNNMIAPMENAELDNIDNIDPFYDVMENDLENENGIFVFQNGFPVWLLRIHDGRFVL